MNANPAPAPFLAAPAHSQCGICRTVIVGWAPNCLTCGAHGRFAAVSEADAKAWHRRQAQMAAMAEAMRRDSRAPRDADERDFFDDGPVEPAQLLRLDEIPHEEIVRMPTHEADVDRVLGGGYVAGKIYALHAPPGAGKSRLAMRSACRLCKIGPVIYVSTTAELPVKDVERYIAGAKLNKFSFVKSRLRILRTDDPDEIADAIRKLGAVFTVVDSIATLYKDDVPGRRGDRSQIEYGMWRLRETIEEAEERGESAALLGLLHETKDGKQAGPAALAYLFDTMLQLRRVAWVGPGISETGAPTPSRYVPTDEPSKVVRLQSGAGGKTRNADPTAFQIFRLGDDFGIAPVRGANTGREEHDGKVEGFESTRAR